MLESLENGTFYHDDRMNKSAKTLKSSMTLDFASTAQKTRVKLNDVMLNSPDINMLKLASPELERLIIQQGGVMTAATPTTQILFPKSVTEEQEAYARGFVDALAELHKKPEDEDDDEDSSMSNVSSDVMGSEVKYTTLTNVSKPANATAPQTGETAIRQPSGLVSSAPGQFPAYTTVTNLPGSVFPVSTATTTVPSSSTTSLMHPQEILVHNQPLTAPRNPSPALQYISTSGQHSQLMYIKEEPQRVPSLSPQLTPINMVAQEGIKLERKRARNRVAARKCRTRKLERISRLEDRVSELKGQNSTLVSTASELREQVFALKQQILEHVNSGCKVMLSANML